VCYTKEAIRPCAMSDNARDYLKRSRSLAQHKEIREQHGMKQFRRQTYRPGPTVQAGRERLTRCGDRGGYGTRHAASSCCFAAQCCASRASDRPPLVARVYDNLRRFGFAGCVFPVNPNRGEIWGTACFPDFAAPPEPPTTTVFTPAEIAARPAYGAAAGRGAPRLMPPALGRRHEKVSRSL
jgi:hypothetical protein